MTTIRKAVERCARALSIRPAFGRSAAVSRTRVRPGLPYEIEEGPWKLTADLPAQLGGGGSAPAPGVFGRAALGSCLAVRYMLRAEQMHVPIASLEVEVQTDDHPGALLGVGEGPAGYHEVRYTVTVESSAPDADVRRVIDHGDEQRPSIHVFAFRRLR